MIWRNERMKITKRKPLTWREGYSSHGRSTIYVKCPFCEKETEVYIWSFRGCGKICECGVKLIAWSATKILEEE